MTLYPRALITALRLAGLLLLPVSTQGRGEVADVPVEASKILFGDCKLAVDPKMTGEWAPSPLVCLRAAVGAESTSVSGTPDENSWLKYGTGGVGVFLTRWLAFQGRGSYLAVIPLQESAEGYRDAHLDYAVMQIGNPVLSPVRINIGRLKLPFGIDRSDATRQYQSFEDRRFWASPPHGAYLTLDNKESFQAEIGFATNQYLNREVATETGEPKAEQPLNNAFSFRIMTDYSALDGSRLVLSGYEDQEGVRRLGGGFLTVSRREDLTYFEFVRRMLIRKENTEPFAQLLRAGYASAWRGDTRWVVQIDDERLRFRRGLVAADVRWTDFGKIRFGVSYHKSETGDDLRRWYVTTGVEAHL